ncbi:MAG TPA: ketoacyl-ACP synthase III [Deltaproteobacteria bacterium]|nr:ketoacyl-ACP synthase III [Deltaproteobacteria bacterium]
MKTALYAPPHTETAQQLAPRLGRSPEWVVDRTGVVERRISDESMAVLGARAACEALQGTAPDLIVNASLTPIQLIPDSSVFIQRELGLEGIPSFSIHATCLSFLVGLQACGALIQAGSFRRILLVSAEQGSVCRDLSEPESAALIGDGAAAAVLERAPTDSDSALLGFAMRTYPAGAAHTELRGCGTRRHPNDPRTRPTDNLFQMNGPRIYRMAYSHADEVLDDAFAQAGLSRGEVDLVVPHQASGPMLKAIPRFGFPEHKVIDLISTYGNCIAASIPMALATAQQQGRLSRGDTVLLFGTGAGLSLAAMILRF